MYTIRKRLIMALGGVALAAATTFTAGGVAHATSVDPRGAGRPPAAANDSGEHPTWRAFHAPQVFRKGSVYIGDHAVLRFQNNGNMIVVNDQGNTMWDTDTRDVGAYAMFRDDGDLAVYTADHKVAWESHTAGNPGATLWLTDNAHLTIFNTAGRRLWLSPGIW